MTPPVNAVMVPIKIHTQVGKPASMLLLIPTIVKNPNPIVSKIKSSPPHLESLDLKRISVTKANPVVIKYLESIIQNDVVLRNKSLIVPPPIAVTNPIT